MIANQKLPEPYEEVFIWWNNNGTIVRRVARLHAERKYFQLSTYLASTKGQYLAPLDKVERWESIVSAASHSDLLSALHQARTALCDIRLNGAGARVIGADIDAIDDAVIAARAA